MREVEVVAAIIIYNNQILCVQKGVNKLDYLSNKFEFPGGKIEYTETKEEAIKREIMEELRMEVIPQKVFCSTKHQYPDFKLVMHAIICTCLSNNLVLTEHISFKWLAQNELENLDWAAADIPVVNLLMETKL